MTWTELVSPVSGTELDTEDFPRDLQQARERRKALYFVPGLDGCVSSNKMPDVIMSKQSLPRRACSRPEPVTMVMMILLTMPANITRDQPCAKHWTEFSQQVC